MPSPLYKLTAILRPTALLKHPVVIVGCGRSGTTILGNLLQQHPDLAYLNEARDIWNLDTRSDLWTDRSQKRGAKLVLRADDLTPRLTRALQQRFAERIAGKRLVEKLPINSFRISYVDRVLPGAQYVHMLRHGVEVAQSIAREVAKYNWYGHADYKWQRLTDLARSQGLESLVAIAGNDPILRGLLEWRLSVTTVQRSLAAFPPGDVLEIRYGALVDEPVTTYTQIESFLKLRPDDAPRRFAAEEINRRSPQAPALTSAMQQIAGELLESLGYITQKSG